MSTIRDDYTLLEEQPDQEEDHSRAQISDKVYCEKSSMDLLSIVLADLGWIPRADSRVRGSHYEA